MQPQPLQSDMKSGSNVMRPTVRRRFCVASRELCRWAFSGNHILQPDSHNSCDAIFCLAPPSPLELPLGLGAVGFQAYEPRTQYDAVSSSQARLCVEVSPSRKKDYRSCRSLIGRSSSTLPLGPLWLGSWSWYDNQFASATHAALLMGFFFNVLC